MRKQTIIALVAVLVCGLLLAGIALASTTQSYAITWWTIDNGGAMFSTGGNYSVGGTMGQPDAATMSGDRFTLSGGFWRGGTASASPNRIYLPVVLRQSS
jgi:hypothetical protein